MSEPVQVAADELAVRSSSGRRPDRLGREFSGLWTATAASNLGDGLVVVILPLIALRLSDSPGAVAAVTVASTAAWPLFGLLAGVAVDSLERRRLLLVVNGFRAVVLSAVAAAWTTDSLTLPMIYAAAVILGVGETLADTALTSMVPALVPPSRRGAANARIETTINVLNQLIGPPLAGALLAASVVLAASAASGAYLVGLLGLALLVSGPTPGRASVESKSHGSVRWRSRAVAGVVLLWDDALLRRLTVLTAAMNIVWAAWTAVFVLYAVSPGPLDLTPWQYGLLLAGMAVGGVVAGSTIGPLVRSVGVRGLLLLDLIGTVTLVAPAALGLGVVPVAVGAIIAGAGSTIWRTIVGTIRQNCVDDQILGRVYAASRLVSWGVLPIGAAVGGALAQAYGTRTALGAAALLATGVALAFGPMTRSDNLDMHYNGTRRPDPAQHD
jgi:MFS family permease